MDCAFIGFGNAAFGISAGLRRAGLGDVYFLEPMAGPPFSGALGERVIAMGALCRNDYALLAASAPVIFSCVVATAALDVARKIAPHLTGGQLYVDINSTSPSAKQEAAALVSAAGALYVDAAVMGSVEVSGHRVPILASGDGAGEFARLFAPLGMDIEVLEGRAGQAAAVKQLRSVFQKGMMCLFMEMLLAARACGVEKEVLASVGKTFDGVTLETMAGQMVPKAVNGAARMVGEMEGVRRTLEELGLPAFMSAATVSGFACYDALNLAGRPFKTLDQALHAVHHAITVSDMAV